MTLSNKVKMQCRKGICISFICIPSVYPHCTKYVSNKCTKAKSVFSPNSSPQKESVFLLIIPVRSSRLHFTSGLKVPPKNQLDPLQQVTRNLDMSHIRKMVLGVNIVMLQQTLGGEIVDETTVLEVLIDLSSLFLVVSAADVLLAFFGESSPLGLFKLG